MAAIPTSTVTTLVPPTTDLHIDTFKTSLFETEIVKMKHHAEVHIHSENAEHHAPKYDENNNPIDTIHYIDASVTKVGATESSPDIRFTQSLYQVVPVVAQAISKKVALDNNQTAKLEAEKDKQIKKLGDDMEANFKRYGVAVNEGKLKLDAVSTSINDQSKVVKDALQRYDTLNKDYINLFNAVLKFNQLDAEIHLIDEVGMANEEYKKKQAQLNVKILKSNKDIADKRAAIKAEKEKKKGFETEKANLPTTTAAATATATTQAQVEVNATPPVVTQTPLPNGGTRTEVSQVVTKSVAVRTVALIDADIAVCNSRINDLKAELKQLTDARDKIETVDKPALVVLLNLDTTKTQDRNAKVLARTREKKVITSFLETHKKKHEEFNFDKILSNALSKCQPDPETIKSLGDIIHGRYANYVNDATIAYAEVPIYIPTPPTVPPTVPPTPPTVPPTPPTVPPTPPTVPPTPPTKPAKVAKDEPTKKGKDGKVAEESFEDKIKTSKKALVIIIIIMAVALFASLMGNVAAIVMSKKERHHAVQTYGTSV